MLLYPTGHLNVEPLTPGLYQRHVRVHFACAQFEIALFGFFYERQLCWTKEIILESVKTLCMQKELCALFLI